MWPGPATLKGRWEERRWVELNPPQIIAFFVVNLSRCVMISVWALSKSGLLQTQRQRERVGGNVVTLYNYNTITPCLVGTETVCSLPHYRTQRWSSGQIHDTHRPSRCSVSRVKIETKRLLTLMTHHTDLTSHNHWFLEYLDLAKTKQIEYWKYKL